MDTETEILKIDLHKLAHVSDTSYNAGILYKHVYVVYKQLDPLLNS